MSDYRKEAQNQLVRAQAELATGEDERIKYAALELREAIESLTYDRALAYQDDFPPSEYETWQPKIVMRVLLDIDGDADRDVTLSIGREPSPGVRPDIKQLLGTERVFNLALIKKHYDALGSHLHVQTLRQRQKRPLPNYPATRRRCIEIADYIRGVLSSPIRNIIISDISKCACVACGTIMRRRVPKGAQKTQVQCFECKADYTVERLGAGKVYWEPDQLPIACANQGCRAQGYFYRNEIVAGLTWACEACCGVNEIDLAVRHLGATSDTSAVTPDNASPGASFYDP